MKKRWQYTEWLVRLKMRRKGMAEVEITIIDVGELYTDYSPFTFTDYSRNRYSVKFRLNTENGSFLKFELDAQDEDREFSQE